MEGVRHVAVADIDLDFIREVLYLPDDCKILTIKHDGYSEYVEVTLEHDSLPTLKANSIPAKVIIEVTKKELENTVPESEYTVDFKQY